MKRLEGLMMRLFARLVEECRVIETVCASLYVQSIHGFLYIDCFQNLV